jgi:hypothetical protein
MPRFMLFVYSGGGSRPSVELVEAMNRFNEELLKAGVLLALDGLHPPSTATRLTFSGGERPTVTDGPFTESKEFVGGYWIIQARSKEEAVEWASRAPIDDGAIEVRQIAEAEDYPQDIAKAAEMSGTPPEQTIATE